MHPCGMGLFFLQSVYPSSSSRKAWRSRARVKKRREGGPKPQLSTASQLRLQSQGWQCCSSYLHDLESPGQAAGRKRKASSSSSMCSQGQGKSGRGQRGGCQLGCATPATEHARCTRLLLPLSQPQKGSSQPPHLLWTAFCGSWVCSHGSTCVGRGEHLTRLGPSTGQQERE